MTDDFGQLDGIHSIGVKLYHAIEWRTFGPAAQMNIREE